MVQGATEDGVKLSDEQDIDEANSDTEAEEEKKRKKMTEPYVPTYIRMLAETSNRRKKGPKTVTRTTRSELMNSNAGLPSNMDAVDQ